MVLSVFSLGVIVERFPEAVPELVKVRLAEESPADWVPKRRHRDSYIGDNTIRHRLVSRARRVNWIPFPGRDRYVLSDLPEHLLVVLLRRHSDEVVPASSILVALGRPPGWELTVAIVAPDAVIIEELALFMELSLAAAMNDIIALCAIEIKIEYGIQSPASVSSGANKTDFKMREVLRRIT